MNILRILTFLFLWAVAKLAIADSEANDAREENKYSEMLDRIQNNADLSCYDKFRSINDFMSEYPDGNEFESRRNAKLLDAAKKQATKVIFTCSQDINLGEYDFKRQQFLIKPSLESGECGIFGCTSPVIRLTDSSYGKSFPLKKPENEAEVYKDTTKLSLRFQFKLSSFQINKFHKPCKARALADCNHDELKFKPIALEIRDEQGSAVYSKGKWVKDQLD